jgi:hypothetical protein
MTSNKLKFPRQLYYTLSTIARRIIKYMRTRRDVLLILLGLLMTALIVFFPEIIRANWNLPIWWVISIGFADLMGLAVLIWFITYLLKGIQEIDAKDKIEQKNKDTRLINAINKGINQTLESAIQKQTEAIITAIKSLKNEEALKEDRERERKNKESKDG